jgi:rSAM/selenodomain-associated transferase 2
VSRRSGSAAIAVIIPALSEEHALARLLPSLGEAAEVVVSDGGSRDGTVALARRLGARVVEGAPGRGAQLNRGAAASVAPILLFLHADTSLPAGALEAIAAAVDAGAEGGGFRVRFASARPVFALGSAVVNLRTRLTGWPLGDQAQFVTREAFEAIGGYAELALLEDLDFIRRLARRGRTRLLPLAVETSARRFEAQGTLSTILRNWLIFALYFARVSPARLARLYRPQQGRLKEPAGVLRSAE